MNDNLQEWTSEHVAATLKDRPFAASTIASAHNAALHAQREKLEQVIDDEIAKNNALRAQLAAERDYEKR
jgi:hypothetical protein